MNSEPNDAGLWTGPLPHRDFGAPVEVLRLTAIPKVLLGATHQAQFTGMTPAGLRRLPMYRFDPKSGVSAEITYVLERDDSLVPYLEWRRRDDALAPAEDPDAHVRAAAAGITERLAALPPLPPARSPEPAPKAQRRKGTKTASAPMTVVAPSDELVGTLAEIVGGGFLDDGATFDARMKLLRAKFPQLDRDVDACDCGWHTPGWRLALHRHLAHLHGHGKRGAELAAAIPG